MADPPAAPTRVVSELGQPLWVISPHLDDAVLSCGRLLAALDNPLVLTVFGGEPPVAGLASRPWDEGTTGHRDADAAVAVRRGEDRAATALLGAGFRWCPWSQYHDPQPTADDLVTVLTIALDSGGPHGARTVVMPLGIMHPDHVAVGNACLRTITSRRREGVAFYVYAEVPYLTAHPALALERLDHWRRSVALDEVELPQSPAHRRLEAVDAYGTQMPMLRVLLPHIDEDLRQTERYWRVGARDER